MLWRLQLMQEDPSYVPRATRYFLHDDRREGDSGDSEASEDGSDSQPDTSVPQSTQTRVGPSKKLWTPDENKGMWKHDMWELLQKEEAGERPPGSGAVDAVGLRWVIDGEAAEKPGCPEALEGEGRRGGTTLGYRRGGRGETWVPRGSRGGRSGNGEKSFPDEPWRGGWKPSRGRGRGQNWNSDQRKQYVPKQVPKQTAEAA
ncbi:hypothetical protein, conserved [Eimeria praecox]|uniref:Btz domain-containing protein n=1 Tax=Eimeria praecox TaxID=51316 RepID=U6G5I5_9EIME|nr:hypothetical protein, conserved [Eimeria praecox]